VTTQTSTELRQFIARIEQETRSSSVNSIVCSIIQNACAHIAAIARVHEINAHDQTKVNSNDKL
jgi:hypothetical protein